MAPQKRIGLPSTVRCPLPSEVTYAESGGNCPKLTPKDRPRKPPTKHRSFIVEITGPKVVDNYNLTHHSTQGDRAEQMLSPVRWTNCEPDISRKSVADHLRVPARPVPARAEGRSAEADVRNVLLPLCGPKPRRLPLSSSTQRESRAACSHFGVRALCTGLAGPQLHRVPEAFRPTLSKRNSSRRCVEPA